ncbi:MULTISPECIES: GntR family transcriptional regulator [unclassified Pseudarthrobacter]|uniref:GntR family transcriptional regulator n=1 Tax=unclassified Pseudarthrobacter TaxID=2647000 RepID=UPI002106FEB0|nr:MULTISPECIES: GntR family transcriptional regulator [unclassified Pseudarthrobacter]
MSEAAERDGLLDRIRRLVLGGDFPPGAVVPEAFLAQEFEVSRTPIREALKQLQHEGLVEIRPKVGTFVREPTRREIIELFQLKESLEGLAASLLARRGEVQELSILRRNLEESEMTSLTHDTDAYARLVHEFHWTIVRGSDNRKLVEHYERLMNQLAYQRLVLRTVEHPGRLEASTREHRAVLEMIEHKDPFGAESAMRNHVHASSREALTDPAPDGRH